MQGADCEFAGFAEGRDGIARGRGAFVAACGERAARGAARLDPARIEIHPKTNSGFFGSSEAEVRRSPDRMPGLLGNYRQNDVGWMRAIVEDPDLRGDASRGRHFRFAGLEIPREVREESA